MKEELVNLHAGLCTLWVDHALLEPEIPRNSLVILSPIDKFENDGIYAVRDESDIVLVRCSGEHLISISNNKGHSVLGQEAQKFANLVAGKVIGHLKIWGLSGR